MWDGAGARKDMKRLRRIIFNGLTVLSLMLCVAMGVLWVRSYWIADAFQLNRDRGYCGAMVMRSRLIFYKVSMSDETWAQFKAKLTPGASYSRLTPSDPYQSAGTG